MPHSDSSQRVFEYHERRKAAGENARSFYVRDEHMQILRQFQIENGYANQHAAMQALLERVRSELQTAKNGTAISRSPNPSMKDGT